MKIIKTIYTLLNLKMLAEGSTPEDSTMVYTYDMSKLSSKDYVRLDTRVIEIEVPDDIAQMSAEMLADQLQAMRAEHHAAEQRLIDSIANLRLLAAPKAPLEGELLDDRDLTRPDVVVKREPLNDGYEDADDFQF